MIQAGLERLEREALAHLRETFGEAVELRDLVLLKDETRSVVARCRLGSASGGPAPWPESVIIKVIRDDPARGFTEWASLVFLSETAGARHLAPRWISGNEDRRLFLMEDLGGARTLEDLFAKGSSREALAAVRAMAKGMAELVRATTGREAAFQSLREKLPAGQGLDRRAEASAWLAREGQVRAWFEAVGRAAPKGFSTAIRRIADVYAKPGPFLAFSHGDPAPTNNHVSVDGVRLLDFEYGGFRHALYDLSAWNTLCPLPDVFVEDMRRAFQAELARDRSLSDGDFDQAWAELCSYRVLAILTWISPDVIQADRPWVGENWTSRQAVWAAVTRGLAATAGAQTLAPIHEGFAALQAAFAERWPQVAARSTTPPWPALTRDASHR